MINKHKEVQLKQSVLNIKTHAYTHNMEMSFKSHSYHRLSLQMNYDHQSEAFYASISRFLGIK